MNWIDRMEKKCGRFAITNLSLYITITYAVGFLINIIRPSLYSEWLSLNVGMILKGQIWRIVTFILLPPSSDWIWIIFALYLYYMIATALERTWGSFRFNLYYFSGMLFHVVGAFLAYLITFLSTGRGVSYELGVTYLNLSMFFAFAALFPDTQLLLFFIIPIKIKWLAAVDAVFFGLTILTGFLPPALTGLGSLGSLYQRGQAIAALVAVLNFLIFFLSTRRGHAARKTKRRREQYHRTVQKAAGRAAYADGARHRCEICGRTELTNPELTFRYCSKCKGAHEYCQDHLFTHTHIE